MKDLFYKQQGDILFKRVEDKKFNTKGMKKLETNIVAEGEATGHAHRFAEPQYQRGDVGLFSDATGRMFVVVRRQAEITHEEHGNFDLPPGNYIVDKVREKDHISDEVRRVID